MNIIQLEQGNNTIVEIGRGRYGYENNTLILILRRIET